MRRLFFAYFQGSDPGLCWRFCARDNRSAVMCQRISASGATGFVALPGLSPFSFASITFLEDSVYSKKQLVTCCPPSKSFDIFELSFVAFASVHDFFSWLCLSACRARPTSELQPDSSIALSSLSDNYFFFWSHAKQTDDPISRKRTTYPARRTGEPEKPWMKTHIETSSSDMNVVFGRTHGRWGPIDPYDRYRPSCIRESASTSSTFSFDDGCFLIGFRLLVSTCSLLACAPRL
jgi:hypothetical protein